MEAQSTIDISKGNVIHWRRLNHTFDDLVVLEKAAARHARQKELDKLKSTMEDYCKLFKIAETHHAAKFKQYYPEMHHAKQTYNSYCSTLKRFDERITNRNSQLKQDPKLSTVKCLASFVF
eukprot:GHVL01004913.1.p1 GENE.GHVL01004913.1~~GHVL01004913.1.p1  ORF type:complete len:121 (-),score=9.87 GHVL01004913.1:215-577(-)